MVQDPVDGFPTVESSQDNYEQSVEPSLNDGTDAMAEQQMRVQNLTRALKSVDIDNTGALSVCCIKKSLLIALKFFKFFISCRRVIRVTCLSALNTARSRRDIESKKRVQVMIEPGLMVMAYKD